MTDTADHHVHRRHVVPMVLVIAALFVVAAISMLAEHGSPAVATALGALGLAGLVGAENRRRVDRPGSLRRS